MTRYRLLIVHPEPSALAMLASMLRGSGHELVEADSDRQAVRRLVERYDLAVVGVDLAEPDSWELLAYIRRRHPEMPVVLLSDQPHADRYDQALRLGADEVLPYPIAANELRQSLSRALERSRMRRQPVQASQATTEEDQANLSSYQPVEEAGSLVPPRGVPPARCSDTPENVTAEGPIRPLKEALGVLEREFIVQALAAFGGNRQETATALDINRTTLYKKMRKHGLMSGAASEVWERVPMGASA